LAVQGSLGKENITVGVGDSAKSIADSINTNSEGTGVTATGITTAQLNTLGEEGAISFDLFGQNEDDAATVTANIANKDDLTDLASAINEQSGKTGITATLTEDKKGVNLKNTEGYDITIDNFTTSATTKTFNIQGTDKDDKLIGSATAGVMTSGAATDVATVGGRLEMDSNKGFTVTSGVAAEITLAVDTADASTLVKVADIDIGTQAGSNDALNILDGALAKISDSRASLGATQNRFSSTISNLENVSQNVSASRSRIQDADFAKESANLAKNQVLQQAGTAMLSQANASTQSVLSLLQ
jgi:flagellin